MTPEIAFGAAQTIALVGGFFYFAGQLRSDTRALKAAVLDHENRLRRVEGVEVEIH